LVARFHREGLDHVDLNAHNILFDEAGKGWMIDFDRCRMHIPATAWRERNLARLQRSLRKVAGPERREAVDAGFARLGHGYDARWADRKSTRLNSSHVKNSYAVFCLKK